MSVILLSANHIGMITANVAYLLQPCSYLNNFIPSDNLDKELKKALQSCFIKTTGGYCYDEVYDELVKLNLAAFNECYAARHGEATAADVGRPSKIFPYIFKQQLEYKDGRRVITQEFYTFSKILDSFLYQCEESCNRNNELLKALNKLLQELNTWIIHATSEYKNAPWTI